MDFATPEIEPYGLGKVDFYNQEPAAIWAAEIQAQNSAPTKEQKTERNNSVENKKVSAREDEDKENPSAKENKKDETNSSIESPAGEQAKLSQEKSKNAIPEKKTVAEEQKLKDEQQSSTYKLWHAGVTKGDTSFEKTYELALAYCKQFSDTSKFHNEKELKAVTDWIQHQRERPSVEIGMLDWIKAKHTPSNEEIGIKIAKQLGFSQGEMMVYAIEHGYKSPGAAFYHGVTSDDGSLLIDRAKKDPAGLYRVSIGEMDAGAIAGMKKWLKEERASNLPANPILNYDYAKERSAFEAIFAHVYNPVASAGSGAMNSLADVVQGVGLPAHILSDRTFMDRFADWMRTKGDAMPMYSLYTDNEMNDAIVMIANIYGQAAGTAAPYLATGGLSRAVGGAGELGAAANSYAAAAKIMGMSQMAGGVYNSALEFQVRQIVLKESGTNELSQEAFAKRVKEIKEGINIDPQKRGEIENRALIAAVVAAPAGVIPAEFLEELGTLQRAGTPISAMPGEFMQRLYNSALKGGLIGAGTVVAAESSLVVAGVKTPQEAGRAIEENAPLAAAGGAMIGMSGESAAEIKARLGRDGDGRSSSTFDRKSSSSPGSADKESIGQNEHEVSKTGIKDPREQKLEITRTPGLAGTETGDRPRSTSFNSAFVEGTLISPGQEYIIGRQSAGLSNIGIDKNTISAQHCTVRLGENGNYVIRDLGSTNGTYINGSRLTPGVDYLAGPGDKITLASHALELGQANTLVRFAGHEYVVGQGGEIYIGRNYQNNAEPSVSRNHLRVGKDNHGLYVEDMGSSYGSSVIRNGQKYELIPNKKFYLDPADRVLLADRSAAGPQVLELYQKQALKSDNSNSASLDSKIAKIPDLPEVKGPIERKALEQSNLYTSRHEIQEKLADGWHNAGADSPFNAQGKFEASYVRPATVVDRQNDPVLQAVIKEAKERFGHLPPRERAAALTKFSRELMTPEGWSGASLDAWYSGYNTAHAGERILLGQFIKEHKGVCSQQALLLKVLADEFPDLKVKLVRGNSVGSGNDELNHAWTEFDFGDGKPLIYDPRQQQYGKGYQQYPHRPGRSL